MSDLYDDASTRINSMESDIEIDNNWHVLRHRNQEINRHRNQEINRHRNQEIDPGIHSNGDYNAFYLFFGSGWRGYVLFLYFIVYILLFILIVCFGIISLRDKK